MGRTDEIGLVVEVFDVLILILAHLKKIPDYYDRLDEMEAEAEEYWSEDELDEDEEDDDDLEEEEGDDDDEDEEDDDETEVVEFKF